MNRRLLLALYDRSGLGAYMPVDYNGHTLEVAEHMEKFAQLIVQECAKAVEDSIWHLPRGYKAVDQAKFVKRHFGVEE